MLLYISYKVRFDMPISVAMSSIRTALMPFFLKSDIAVWSIFCLKLSR